MRQSEVSKMPEIAEVETVRNTLKRMILNKKIVDHSLIIYEWF